MFNTVRRDYDKIVHLAEVSRIVGANRGRSASSKKRKTLESSSSLPKIVEANFRRSEGELPPNFSPKVRIHQEVAQAAASTGLGTRFRACFPIVLRLITLKATTST